MPHGWMMPDVVTLPNGKILFVNGCEDGVAGCKLPFLSVLLARARNRRSLDHSFLNQLATSSILSDSRTVPRPSTRARFTIQQVSSISSRLPFSPLFPPSTLVSFR